MCTFSKPFVARPDLPRMDASHPLAHLQLHCSDDDILPAPSALQCQAVMQ